MATRRELKVRVLRRGGEDRDALVERTVRELAKALFSTRMANTLRITVKMRSTALDKNTSAEAHWRKVESARSKHYEVVVDRELPSAQLRGILAHEMCHVRQYATGALRHGTLGGERGRFWRPGPGPAVFFPYATTDYWTCPWEVEAREVQAAFKG